MVLTVIFCLFLFMFICLAVIGVSRKFQDAVDLKTRKKIVWAVFCGVFIFSFLLINHLEVPQLIAWEIMCGIFLVFNVFDWHSTVLCIKEYGVEREANAWMRSILEEGIKPFSLIKLLVGPILIFIIFYANRECFSFQVAANVAFLVTVIRNYIFFLQGKLKKEEKWIY